MLQGEREGTGRATLAWNVASYITYENHEGRPGQRGNPLYKENTTSREQSKHVQKDADSL